MAQLFKLTYTKSKTKKPTVIMVDILRKCENYRNARSVQVKGHYEILPAEEGETKHRKKSPKSGYISKNGFNAHT